MALSDAAPFATAVFPMANAGASVGGFTLTNNGSATFTTGFFGNAVDLESGSTQWLSNATAAGLTNGGVKFYARAWIRGESGGGGTNNAILSKVNTDRAEYVLRRASDDVLRLEVYAGDNFGSPTLLDSTFGALSNATNYRVAFWHDPDNDILGVSVNTTRTTAAYSAGIHSNNSDFQVGAQAPYGQHFDGLIGEVVILQGYVLDATEESDDYNGGSGLAYSSWGGGGGGGTKSPLPFRRQTRFFRGR